MNVLFAASEVTPVVKTGGLADVVGALPGMMKKLGVDARIVIPAYAGIDLSVLAIAAKRSVQLETIDGMIEITIQEGTLPGSTVPLYLVHTDPGLSLPAIYPLGPEENNRFWLFGQAVLAWLDKSGWQPDIIHGHDWMAGLLISLVQERQLPYKTLLTIHNGKYQGEIATKEAVSRSMQRYDEAGKINPAKIGLLAATKINTVSPNYAKELLTAEYGYGLEKVYRSRQADFSGIINGLDTERFRPYHNHLVNPGYTVRTAMPGKQQHKYSLTAKLGLNQDTTIPLYGVVGRAAGQKGLEILVEALDNSPFLDHAQLVVQVGHGTVRVEEALAECAKRHPDSFKLLVGFDEAFSHSVYAASDFFIMPSKFEPCGLTQLIAMRYGTIPVVRATGGLVDTITDVSRPNGTGISFAEYEATALSKALGRSMALYRDKDRLNQVIRRGMQQDFSWDKSAKEYLQLYRDMVVA